LYDTETSAAKAVRYFTEQMLHTDAKEELTIAGTHWGTERDSTSATNETPDRPHSSKYTGVSFQKKARKWSARLTKPGSGRKEYLGLFDTEEEAALKVLQMAQQWGKKLRSFIHKQKKITKEPIKKITYEKPPFYPEIIEIVLGSERFEHDIRVKSDTASNPRKRVKSDSTSNSRKRKRAEDFESRPKTSNRSKPKKSSKRAKVREELDGDWQPTKYKHVFYSESTGKWKVQHTSDKGNRVKLRLYENDEHAAREADVLIMGLYHGKHSELDRSLLNFPNQWKEHNGKIELNPDHWRRKREIVQVSLLEPESPPSKKRKLEETQITTVQREASTKSPKISCHDIYTRMRIIESRVDAHGRLQYLLWWHSRIGEIEEWFSSRYLKEELPYFKQVVGTFENGLRNEFEEESSSESFDEEVSPNELCIQVKSEPLPSPLSPEPPPREESPVIAWSGHFPCCDTGPEMDDIESFRCVKCAEWWHTSCLVDEFLWEEQIIEDLREDGTIFLCPDCSPGSQTSRFRGVTVSNHPSKPWQGHVEPSSGRVSVGLFETEIEAAIEINQKCQDLGLPLSNPIIEGHQSCVSDFILHTKHYAPSGVVMKSLDMAVKKMGSLHWRAFKSNMSDPLKVSQEHKLDYRTCLFIKNRMEFELKHRERAEARLKRGNKPIRAV